MMPLGQDFVSIASFFFKAAIEIRKFNLNPMIIKVKVINKIKNILRVSLHQPSESFSENQKIFQAINQNEM